MQFVIFLSALLASLTGLVAGERQPVRAQVEMSASGAASVAEKAVAAVQPAIDLARTRLPSTRPAALAARTDVPARVMTGRTRLALKQSWLF